MSLSDFCSVVWIMAGTGNTGSIHYITFLCITSCHLSLPLCQHLATYHYRCVIGWFLQGCLNHGWYVVAAGSRRHRLGKRSIWADCRTLGGDWQLGWNQVKVVKPSGCRSLGTLESKVRMRSSFRGKTSPPGWWRGWRGADGRRGCRSPHRRCLYFYVYLWCWCFLLKFSEIRGKFWCQC